MIRIVCLPALLSSSRIPKALAKPCFDQPLQIHLEVPLSQAQLDVLHFQPSIMHAIENPFASGERRIKGNLYLGVHHVIHSAVSPIPSLETMAWDS